jgi:23S rRNA (uracil1939-C5)-methyltransferase
VSAGSFFQTNRYLARELVQTVAGDFHGKIALDLFAGVGLFANHLSKRFDQVFAVESSALAAADLQANAQKNVVPVRSTTEGFLPRCLNMQPELVVVDPPRAGLGHKSTQLLAALRVKRIVYVSCDPATLARDVRLLLETGYHVEEVHLIDLFPQTFHIESVVRLAR